MPNYGRVQHQRKLEFTIVFRVQLVLTGAVVQKFIYLLGDFSIFMGVTLRGAKKIWKRRSLFLKQCEFIGVTSSGIVFVAAVFLGAVLGYQLYVSFHYFGAESLLGGSVGLALFRELGPVMASIMVTGRAGAAIAAQLASMRITEQIDALEVMAVDPYEYLVAPRVIAGVLMVPILSVFFSAIGTLAASLVACGVMDLSYATYWEQFSKVVDLIDLKHCVIKAAVFGLVLTFVGCFYGFRAQGGAQSVGYATRTTVVVSCLGILLSDYVLTSLLPFGWAWLTIT
jgi:phospholipid/cholesterol/gamma-HCH transport system permease protein